MTIAKKFGPLANFQFDKLYLGQVFSHFADAIVQFVLIGWILLFLDTAAKAMACVFFSFLLPQFLLSSYAGVLVDKFSRKKVLALSCLYRSAMVVLVGLTIHFAAANSVYIPVHSLCIFSFLLGIGAAVFYPAKMAAVTNIVKSSQLKFANAITSAVPPLALLLGAILANIFITKLGVPTALAVVAVFYAIAFLLIWWIKFPQSDSEKSCEESQKSGYLTNMKSAFSYLNTHKRAYFLVCLSIALSFIVAVFSNSLNALITDQYKMAFSDLTFIRFMLGAGVILGMGAALFFARFMRVPHLLASAFGILCIALITSPFCKTMDAAWFWLVPIGIADAVIIVMIDTILQKAVPDRIRGKIFGLQLTLTTLSFLAGTMLVIAASDVLAPLEMFKLLAFTSFIIAFTILVLDKSFRYFLLKATIGQIFLAAFKYNVEGVEHLPKKGKVILAGNHTGHLDPLILQMATHRQLWFVTGPAAFHVPIVRHFLKYFNVIALVPGKGVDAIEQAVNKLNKGEAVVIFPEGKFTPDGNLCKFNKGVARIAEESDAPIIPFAIQGGYETWNKKIMLPKFFNKLTIQFGQPVEYHGRDEKEIVSDLRNRVEFMKHSLERKAIYHIENKFYDNFLDLMQQRGDLYASNKALSIKTRNGYEDLSYIELSRLAKNFANYLIESVNIQKNDRIAILSESRPEFGIAMFASIQTGAITVPLDVKLTVSELTSILSDCNPRVLCISSHYLKTALEVKNNVPSIKYIFIIEETKPENCDVPSVFELKSDTNKDLGIPRSLDDTALIVYTSGTTGNPKGVMISFGNIYSQLRDFEQLFKINHKNTLVSILPLNHLLELNVGFFGMLYMGAKVVYMKTLSPKEIAKTLKETKATNMLVVPLFVKMLKSSVEKEIKKKSPTAQMIFKFMYGIAKVLPLQLRRLLFKSVIDGFGGKLECFVCGGAPLDMEVGEFFERIGILVYQGYGLTETSPTVSTNYPNNFVSESVGKPLPSVRVKIAQNGEVLVQGPNVMQGYYNKPEMTAEVLDDCGWFHTGDIGEIDSNGYLYITGRIKNMIVLGGGKKIFPEEVEAVIEKSQYVKEVCVLSMKITSGNKAGTEEVGAVIVPCDDLAAKPDDEIQKILEDEVKNLSEKYLAPYKQPTVIKVYKGDLPKTSTRKVKRNELLKNL